MNQTTLTTQNRIVLLLRTTLVVDSLNESSTVDETVLHSIGQDKHFFQSEIIPGSLHPLDELAGVYVSLEITPSARSSQGQQHREISRSVPYFPRHLQS